MSGKTTATYTYDANNNLLTATIKATDLKGQTETITSTYTYNRANMPTNLETKYGSTIIERYTAQYLANGNIYYKQIKYNNI